MKLEKKSIIFIQENAFENVVCEKADHFATASMC